MTGLSLLGLLPTTLVRLVVPRLRYFDLVRAIQLAHVEAGLPRPLDGQRILEVGSGNGISLLSLALQRAVVTGIDIDPRKVEVAQRLARALRFDRTEASFQVASLASLPYPERSVDVVVVGRALEQAEDEVMAFKEMGRVLRPGGLLALTVVAAEQVRPWPLSWLGSLGGTPGTPQTRRFNATDLRQKLELVGFEVVDTGAYLTGIGTLAIDILAGIDRRHPQGQFLYGLLSLLLYLPAIFSDAMGTERTGYGLRIFAVRRSDAGGPPRSNGNGHGLSLKYTAPMEKPTHAVASHHTG